MTAPRFFHFASIGILFAWSGVMLYYYASGRVAAVLTESFHIAPLIGGLGLAVVGFFNLFTAKAEAACCHDHGEPGQVEDANGDTLALNPARACEDTGCDHAHEPGHHHAHAHVHHHHSHDDQTIPGMLATLIIVLVPAIGAAALSQDKFSVQTLANKGLYSNEVAPVAPLPSSKAKDDSTVDEDRYTLADLEKQVRKNEAGNFIIPVPSLFYSAADEELADVLQGQPIETSGQIAPEIAKNDPKGTRLRLYRLFISCCLADARPIGFSADFGKAPPDFAEDTWVKIVGKMVYPDQDGRRIPVIKVDRIETIPEPEDMMY